MPSNVAPSDISVIGPLARSADDLGLALDVIAGPDPIKATGWRLDLAPPRGRLLSDYRVAVMLDKPNSQVDGVVQDALQELADFLSREGAQVSDRARPQIDWTQLHAIYITLLRFATWRNISKEEFLR